jgi:iron uptake system component EfeO
VVLYLAAGDYLAACTAGPTAEEITTALSVADSGVTVVPSAAPEGAAEAYAAWVSDTAADLRDATDELAVAFVTGDPGAQQLYRQARALWASLRPALARFPELLPAIDARESDLVVGERLSGWHAIEKDLWPPSDYQPLDADGRSKLSAQLQTDLAELLNRVDGAAAMDAVGIAAGAQDLLDAASRSLSDGDERWSHAELWLVQGGLDGAEAAIDALRPALAKDLLAVIDDRGESLQDALDGDASPREIATRIDSLATALSLIAVETARIEP